jgi:hypothetical protein
VEVSGIEPPTSSLRTKRSSQLSYTPKGECQCYRAPGPIVVPGSKNHFSRFIAPSKNNHMLWSRSSRKVRLGAVVGALLCLFLFAGCTPEQTDAYDRINAIRTANGLPTMLPSPPAMAKAQAWADHMAATGVLEHSDLWADMPPGGFAVGENVGQGPSLDAVNAAFLQSPKHRANLLDPQWNWVGTGIARTPNGTLFVVQIFANY